MRLLKQNITLIIIATILMTGSAETLAFKFAGKKVQERINDVPASFLRNLGIVVETGPAETCELIDEKHPLYPGKWRDGVCFPELIIKFETLRGARISKSWPIQLFVSSIESGEVLLSVSNPFPESKHVVAYSLPFGHSIMLVFRYPIENEYVSEDYRVVFENKLQVLLPP